MIQTAMKPSLPPFSIGIVSEGYAIISACGIAGVPVIVWLQLRKFGLEFLWGSVSHCLDDFSLASPSQPSTYRLIETVFSLYWIFASYCLKSGKPMIRVRLQFL